MAEEAEILNEEAAQEDQRRIFEEEAQRERRRIQRVEIIQEIVISREKETGVQTSSGELVVKLSQDLTSEF